MLVERYMLEGAQIDQNFNEQVENELYAGQKEYYQLLERMRAIQDQYARLDIRAPAAGVVVNMVAHTVGGVIAPGSPIMDVVPRNDELMIEAQLSPSDIDGVRAGLTADVRFPAFGRTGLPQLTGTVTRVSADRLTNRQRRRLLPGARPRQPVRARPIAGADPGARHAGGDPDQQERAHPSAILAGPDHPQHLDRFPTVAARRHAPAIRPPPPSLTPIPAGRGS